MPDRVEYYSHVFDYSNGQSFGLCLLLETTRKWESYKRRAVAAGFILRQDAETEGTLLFDPANKAQVRLAFKLAGIKPKRVSARAGLETTPSRIVKTPCSGVAQAVETAISPP